MDTNNLTAGKFYELRTALESHMVTLTAHMDRLSKQGTTGQQRHMALRMAATQTLLDDISGISN